MPITKEKSVKNEESRNVLSTLVDAFSSVEAVVLDGAKPPTSPGVYGFLYQGKLRYVGEAKGSKGLSDRIMSKHLSGDESHALQRAFQTRFPDRPARRNFLRRAIQVKWLVVDPPEKIGELERTLIRMHRPEWNRR